MDKLEEQWCSRARQELEREKFENLTPNLIVSLDLTLISWPLQTLTPETQVSSKWGTLLYFSPQPMVKWYFFFLLLLRFSTRASSSRGVVLPQLAPPWCVRAPTPLHGACCAPRPCQRLKMTEGEEEVTSIISPGFEKRNRVEPFVLKKFVSRVSIF